MSTGRDDIGQERAPESEAEECAAFEAALPDYLEGSLSADGDLAARAHLAGCAGCGALVRDLDVIRARASALPALRPERDLWAGIDARIRSGATSGRTRERARQWVGPSWSAASLARAAVLVVSTAIVASSATWLWTRPGSAVGRAPASKVGVPPMVASGSGTTQPPVVNPGPQIPTTGQGPGPMKSATVPVVRVDNGPAAPTNEFIYDQQITTLHQILEQRRGRMDPKTVAVVEKNLRVIDRAIAESKAALAKDPANRFLGQQLDRALDSKLELLRTVALLPSQT